MPSKLKIIKHVTIYASYLLIVWGFYRVLFNLPDEVEEVIVKPIVWLLPLIYVLSIERLRLGSLGITFKNLFPSIYLALGLGSIFVIEALASNYIKYNGFNFSANIGDQTLGLSLAISLATAVSEELAFRGYIFNRLNQALKGEWAANLITTAVWTLMHVPMAIMIMKLTPSATAVYLALVAIFGFGSAYVFARTKNITSSILLHILWSWPIILFR
jgi:membrane protease YdiL (CAAX protease family)